WQIIATSATRFRSDATSQAQLIAINSAPTVPTIPTLPKPASRPPRWEPTIASVKRVERQAKTMPTHLRIESSLFVLITILSWRRTAKAFAHLESPPVHLAKAILNH